MTMHDTNKWVSPTLTSYGSVEHITEQPVGSVTKSGGAGDTISVTIAGNTTVVAGGSVSAAGSSLVNITPDPTTFGGGCV